MAIYLRRKNEPIIHKSINSPYITAILGPRQVGKTSLVENYAKNHPEHLWAFLNLDKGSQRLRIQAEELSNIIEETVQTRIGGDIKIWVVIDEAQKCPAVFDQIKILYDQFKGKNKIKFIITGSSQLSLRKLSAETLTGRIQLYELREFSLQEAALFENPELKLPKFSILEAIASLKKHKDVDNLVKELAPFKISLEKALDNELCWGGLPELLSLHEGNDRIAYLSNYLDTYFEKEVRSLATITDLNLYQKLMGITAEQTGSIRDDKKILEALSCSRDTLKKYRGYLHATLMYQEIFPYIKNAIKRLVKSPKGYLMNNGLISYFSGLYDIKPLQNTGLIGHRFENWLLKELNVWLDRDPKRSTIYYYRTHGGVEIDFIVEKPPIILPIESTYSKVVNQKKQKHLRQFLAEHPSASAGIIIYNGPFQYDKKERIFYLPAWAVC